MKTSPKKIKEYVNKLTEGRRIVLGIGITDREYISKDILEWERELEKKYSKEDIIKVRKNLYHIIVGVILSKSKKVNDIKVTIRIYDAYDRLNPRMLIEYRGLLSKVKENFWIIEKKIESLELNEMAKEYLKALLKYIFY